MLRWLVLSAMFWSLGCAGSRVITISAIPPDAVIRVNNKDRGRGPVTEMFSFSGDGTAHTVSARRAGYTENEVTITPESAAALVIRLKPLTRRLAIRVQPADAVLKLDGKVLSPNPAGEITADLEFPLDSGGAWTSHELTAEHPNFQTIEQTVTYDDRETEYVLDLGARRKDVVINTLPQGANVYIDEELFGASPVSRAAVAFAVDEATGEFKPHKVRLTMRGFETREEQISWDGGQQSYQFKLEPQSKLVRIVTDPPDAHVEVGGVEIPLDATGAHARRIPFPLDGEGDAATYTCVVTKKTADREWKLARIDIGWEEGQTDYRVQLEEILTRSVPMLRVHTARVEGGWSVSGERLTTLAMRDAGEGPDGATPEQITRLPEGTMIDTLALAPDGSQVLFTTLTDAAGRLRSQILTQPTDGTPDATNLTDGESLDIAPVFTPDGSQIVFASDRAGDKLSIWSMPAAGGGGLKQLTGSPDAHDLWPSVDSNPKPRLFYQALLDARAEPRLFSTRIGTAGRRDLAASGGTQPRVGPKADAVVFAAAATPDGKRDLFRMSDQGGAPVNLTNTSDADEFGPAWSNDGRRVAFVSDRERSPEAPDNYDIFVLDVAKDGAEPVRATFNESWDDCPAFDVRGRAIYFRSNRGGEWNIWRIELR